jgi:hypothetical protein
MTILVETTKVSPALVQYVDPVTPMPPSLFVAWTGTNSAHNLNVLASPNGGTWNPNAKVTLQETDLDGPALAAGPGSPLFVAWTGTDAEHHLNFDRSTNGKNFDGKVTLSETSLHSPAIAYSDNTLFLAWTGTDSRLNIATLGSSGSNYGKILHKVTLGETSGVAPALAAVGRHLYLSWSGQDAQHRLNVIESIDGGATWRNKVTMDETTEHQPALAIYGNAAHGLVYVGWTGTDPQHHLNFMHAPLGTTAFTGKQTLRDTSVAGPALAEYQGKIYIAWAGTDNENRLNVAPV